MTITLPTTTEERLRAVADRIEFEPHKWDQGQFYSPRDNTNYGGVAAHAGDGDVDCGTTACVAGWATILLPREEYLALPRPAFAKNWESYTTPWDAAGAHALGFDMKLADVIFYHVSNDTSVGQVLPDVLRRLSKFEAPRTRDHLREVCDDLGLLDEQTAALFDIGDDDDEGLHVLR